MRLLSPQSGKAIRTIQKERVIYNFKVLIPSSGEGHPDLIMEEIGNRGYRLS